MKAKNKTQLKVIAEIKEVKSFKAVSGDKIYRLVVITENPKLMALGLLDAETLIKLNIEAIENNI